MAIKSYEELVRDIKNKIYHPVYLLQGDEAFYIDKISDLLETHSEVEIPIYQADAVYAPTISTTRGNREYKIGTRFKTIELSLPETFIQRNRLFARVLEIMERVIRQRDSVKVFLAILHNEPNYCNEPQREIWEPFLLDMFRKIEELERNDWNRIWCRIVRNYFASVAIGKCHYIAGNPPWVRWSELPSRYTERIKPTCESYGIFSRDRYFGGNELDISGMITYTVADKWLNDQGGRLSFVITQTHFQSQSSGGFRRFEVNGIPLNVLCVDDLVSVRPFRGLGNKPTVLSLEKGQATSYPVNYLKWERTTSSTIPEDANWTTAQQRLRYVKLEANPLSGPGQRWIILPPGNFATLRSLDGQDQNIRGRKGIVTDLNGAYFIELLGLGRVTNTVRFRNVPNLGDKPVQRRIGEIELDLVYPLIKGSENIRAFHATLSPYYVIVPNNNINIREIPLLTSFAKIYPQAFNYFRAINKNGLMELRSTWRTRIKPQYDRKVRLGLLEATEIPFYTIYDVGDYTFAKYKVVWAEISGTLQAAVISEAEVPFGGGVKPIIPDHKVYFAAFDNENYAHYVCALLNSNPIRTFVDSFTIKLQVGTLFRHIKLPAYNQQNRIHAELARLSKEAHQILARGGNIKAQQMEINRLADQLLGQHNVK